MSAMKYSRVKALDVPPYAKLYRISWLQRLIRYEWRDANGKLCLGPSFHATLQEWEKAHD